MKRLSVVAALLAVCGSACVTGDSNERTIRIDYSSDRYGSFFLYNFPKKIAVHPGTTLVFRQTWTGEPHTVTGGSVVRKPLAQTKPLLDIFVTYDQLRGAGAPFPDPENPGDAKFADFAKALKNAQPKEKRDVLIKAYNDLRAMGLRLGDLDNPGDETFAESTKAIDEFANKAFENVPFAFDEESEGIGQNVGQPCYLRTGGPPKNPKKACSKAQHRKPAFDEKVSFYNSGIIRYEGPQGNTFRVPLSKNIKPGKYTFYCAVHGPLQSTEVDVRPAGADIPNQDQVSRESGREINAIKRHLDEVYRDAADGRVTIKRGGESSRIRGPFAGLFNPQEDHAAINAFVPRTLRVRVGEPIKWKIMGSDHTITFRVPRYFPPVEFLKDGTVRLNPKLEPPAGGAPKPPKDETATKVDGGTYDGRGFWSTGLLGPCPECGGGDYLEYTLRISRPGTYQYACLLHPPMVGTVVVTR